MKQKIFVAEDDRAILDIITIILEGDGYVVETTDSGENIAKKITSYEPHLILLDIWLSGHDGGVIAKQLKSENTTKQIPVIMISANNETEKIAKAVGADGFLQKPFNIDDLLQIVKTHVALNKIT